MKKMIMEEGNGLYRWRKNVFSLSILFSLLSNNIYSLGNCRDMTIVPLLDSNFACPINDSPTYVLILATYIGARFSWKTWV